MLTSDYNININKEYIEEGKKNTSRLFTFFFLYTMNHSKERAYALLGEERNKYIRELGEHPRQHQVTWGGSGYHIHDPVADKTISARGITTTLKKLYWPNYTKPNYTNKEYNRLASVTRRISKKAEENSEIMKNHYIVVAANKAMKSARGPVRGSIVHRQVSEYISNTLEVFKRQNPGGLHKMVEHVFAAMTLHGIMPFIPDYRVFDERTRIATEIDLLGVEKRTGTPVFIELKTCISPKHFQAEDGRFHGILGSDQLGRYLGNCSAKNRACVQLALSALMATNNSGYRGPYKCLVIAVYDTGYTTHMLPVEHFTKIYTPLWNNMSNIIITTDLKLRQQREALKAEKKRKRDLERARNKANKQAERESNKRQRTSSKSNDSSKSKERKKKNKK